MPADRRRSKLPQARSSGRQTMVNYIEGGRGGSGGDAHAHGTGGNGGHGMGPSLSFDISVGHFIMHNSVNGDDDCMSGDASRQNAVGRDSLHGSRSGPLIQQNIHQHGYRGIDILHRTVALAAMHDSAESYPQPRCHPETRTKMLDDLRKWALQPHPKTTILWLYGPAGAGKSTIMQTLAGQLRNAGRLGGCFFFKRTHVARGNARTLFATIAYQLALSASWLKTPISETVENDPSIVARSIDTQMRTLISEPSSPYRNHDPLAIIIDGLDECDGHDVQENILRILRNSCSDYTIPFRFFVASRPEPHIREVFDSPFYSGHYRSVNVEQSFHDVRKYLCDEFARIHREHRTMANVPLPWPLPDILEQLVKKSSGHFIYASTIIRFIDDKNYHPTQRLAAVQDANSTDPQSAFDSLDQLYMTILSSAPRQSELVPVLCAIVNFEVDPEQIDQLFRLAEGETRLLLRSLHSVLRIPSNDARWTKHQVSTYHASFLDFLNNPGRSRTFCVGTLHHRIDLARCVLEAFVGPHENAQGFWSRFLASNLIPFIKSLPHSTAVAELFPLIGTMDPECIFWFFAYDVPGLMLAWLKKIPSVPRDLIKLWEDYECMASLENTVLRGPPPYSHTKHIFPCSPECLRILISLVMFKHNSLWKLRGCLDLTWTAMRSAICGPSSNVASDPHRPPVLAVHLAFRDVALQFIRKMVKNHVDIGGKVYSWESRDSALDSIGRHQKDNDATGLQIKQSFTHSNEQHELAAGISYLVRLSPPCPVLYRELWSIPIVPEDESSWLNGFLLIHHVSKWLESFLNPSMELITFWKQAQGRFDSRPIEMDGLDYAENEWRVRVNNWNQTIVHLDLPDDLKISIP
ncbi:NACHT domain-containing protein [Mycena sanguinolenta]|uniref:NACHT domain-containing protein n=1 Tax=Mycena sanguinolenta TaxID=230812 RepID=A0A8H6ZC63_9AGAR|nr:NACHT domain-containing protein [Mycena sanguinolenta]